MALTAAEIARRWRVRHPDRAREVKKRYNRNHAEKVRVARNRYYQKNTHRWIESRRRTKLKARYGLTVEHWEAMNSKQGGLCAICRSLSSMGQRLVVDHSHRTGEVRGLLCRRCNVSLGTCEVVEGWFEAAVTYLRQRNWINGITKV